MTTTDDTTTQPGSTTSRRRARRSTSTTASSTRPRRPRLSGDDLVGQLTVMVDKLIAENRELKRALARVQKSPVGAGLGEAARALAGLQRRVSRALDGDGGRGRRRGAANAAAAVRTRRPITDPEVLERRRAALAKARAARAAKRAAGAGQ